MKGPLFYSKSLSLLLQKSSGKVKSISIRASWTIQSTSAASTLSVAGLGTTDDALRPEQSLAEKEREAAYA